MKQKSMFYNVLVLTAVSLLLRTAGIAYRSFMTRTIGTEGVGLYQLATSLFVLGVTFSTSGISTAVTRLITIEMGHGKQDTIPSVVRKSMKYAITLGLFSFCVLFFLSDWLAAVILSDIRAGLALRVLALSLPVMSVAACLKGYFIAWRTAPQIGMSDILEQLIEMFCFAVLVRFAAPGGIACSCAAIGVSTAVSELCSCLYLWVVYRRSRTGTAVVEPGFTGRLAAIALPITMSALLSNSLRTVENVLIPSKLEQSGMTSADALSIYGMVRGMALPVLFFPAALLSAFTSLLLPELSEANAAGQTRRIRRIVFRVLQLTFLLSIPVSVVFLVFAQPLGEMIYDSAEVGRIMRILAPLIPMMYMDMIADSMLKGLNQQVSVLKYNIVDSAARIVFVFVAVSRFGFPGFMFLMYVSNILNPVLSVFRLLQMTGMKLSWQNWVIKPLLAALLAGCVVNLFVMADPFDYRSIPGTVLGIAAICAVYVVLILVMNSLNREDVGWIAGKVREK